MLYDYSSNGTYVNKDLVGKGKKVEIKNGDEIHLILADKEEGIELEDEIGFTFTMGQDMSKVYVRQLTPQKEEDSDDDMNSVVNKVLLDFESDSQSDQESQK